MRLSLVDSVNDTIGAQVGVNGNKSVVEFKASHGGNHPFGFGIAVHDKFVSRFQTENLKSPEKLMFCNFPLNSNYCLLFFKTGQNILTNYLTRMKMNFISDCEL